MPMFSANDTIADIATPPETIQARLLTCFSFAFSGVGGAGAGPRPAALALDNPGSHPYNEHMFEIVKPSGGARNGRGLRAEERKKR